MRRKPKILKLTDLEWKSWRRGCGKLPKFQLTIDEIKRCCLDSDLLDYEITKLIDACKDLCWLKACQWSHWK